MKFKTYTSAILAAALYASTSHAGENLSRDKLIKFNFVNAEITQITAVYAKASGEKFVLDPAVHGKITIVLPNEVSVADAFDLLSTALSINQFAIVKHGDTFVVESSRNAMHDNIPIYDHVPPEKPEQYATVIFQMKSVSANQIYKSLRSLVSRDGEMLTLEGTNKILITDWVTNISKISKIFAEVDVPTDSHSFKAAAEEKSIKPEAN